jgi:hypothetical protein
MTNKIKEKIKEFITVLPKQNQEVVNLSNWEKISEEIGKKHLLDQDEIDNFQLETGLVLVGIVNPVLFALNIENEVGTSKDEANKIANEVLEKIFNPIVDKLKEKGRVAMQEKPIHWQQNLDFILSGGDYTAFIRRVESPTESRRLKVESNPSKFEDLKSKFTI